MRDGKSDEKVASKLKEKSEIRRLALAKKLVNRGECSKAMRDLKSHGVAVLSPEVVKTYQKIKKNASEKERCCTDAIN